MIDVDVSCELRAPTGRRGAPRSASTSTLLCLLSFQDSQRDSIQDSSSQMTGWLASLRVVQSAQCVALCAHKCARPSLSVGGARSASRSLRASRTHALTHYSHTCSLTVPVKDLRAKVQTRCIVKTTPHGTARRDDRTTARRTVGAVVGFWWRGFDGGVLATYATYATYAGAGKHEQ